MTTTSREPRGIADLLRSSGIAFSGEPAEATIDVLGHAVHTQLRGDPAALTVEVRLRGGTGDVEELRAAAVAAPGDTEFERDAADLVGRRTLIRPDPRAVHDVVFELGKAVVRLGGTGAAPPASGSGGGGTTTDGGWAFVDSPTPLRAGPGDPEVVAMLVPGVWYWARQEGSDVHVRHPSGAEGVVSVGEVNRA